MKALVLFAVVLLFASIGLAEEAVADPKYLDSVLVFLASSGGIVAVGVIVFETALRVIPTAKPLSILIPVKYLVVGIKKISEWVDGVLDKLIEAANRVKEEKK